MRLVTAHRVLIATGCLAAVAYLVFELRHADGTAGYVRAAVAAVVVLGLGIYFTRIPRYLD